MKWNPTKWNEIQPEETKRGAVVAVRACRPSLVLGLLLATITLCVCHVLGELDIWNPAWMIIIIGSWTSIAASETDVNSPLNQTLMDKIRENLDHVERQGYKAGQLGGNGVQLTSADRVFASKFRCPQDCRVNTVTVPLGDVNVTRTIMAAIYDDSAGTPNNLLAYATDWVTLTVADDKGQAIIPMNATISLTGGSMYWTAIVTDAQMQIQAVDNTGGRYGSDLGSDEEFDDPWSDVGGSSTFVSMLS